MSVFAILKRVAPFILTFAAGLFIASFFVTIAAPNFNGFKRNPSRHSQAKRVRFDIEELRREKARLEAEIEMLKSEREIFENSNFSAPPPPFVHEAPMPPPPPAPIRKGVHSKILQ